ncbi:hypothetical protein SAMN05446935_7550 [Burkholderia sp. YR290]|nr:hypothetical protein SAMN05446935_7550 [Burkholderia sp. YR290]
MPLWAKTRKSLDGRGGETGTTWAVGVEPLNDGSFLLVRYEAIGRALPTSDHWYPSLAELFNECEVVYGVERTDWQQRECLPGHPCRTCGRSLDEAGDPLSVSCGGDCLACMAECGDPDCVEAVEALKRTGTV